MQQSDNQQQSAARKSRVSFILAVAGVAVGSVCLGAGGVLALSGDIRQEVCSWFSSAEAQYAEAQLLLSGRGAAANLSGAVELLKSAAEQGDTQAQFKLGVCYAEGLGVPKDAVEAESY